jgi:hypothetical protein
MPVTFEVVGSSYIRMPPVGVCSQSLQLPMVGPATTSFVARQPVILPVMPSVRFQKHSAVMVAWYLEAGGYQHDYHNPGTY